MPDGKHGQRLPYLAWIGRDDGVHFQVTQEMLVGNFFSWGVVTLFFLWAYAFLALSAKKGGALCSQRPGSSCAHRTGGVPYYWATMITFMVLNVCVPETSAELYRNASPLLATLSACGFALCFYLLLSTSDKTRPCSVGAFYRGSDVDPTVLGVSIKQLTNCRFGMMAWQVLILAYHLEAIQRHGVNWGMLANVLLQSVYVAKFFWWEEGYFDTLDMTLDCAGFYVCWGTCVMVPSLYAFSSYYFVAHPPTTSLPVSLVVLALGVFAILLNYRVDYEKQLFRKQGASCRLWGRGVRLVRGEDPGKPALLASGFWGIARHLNYTFEILASLAWTSVGWNLGPWPFAYNAFLACLLVHRVFRDEAKCAAKYGEQWTEYCRLVRYRMVPYVF